MAVLALVPQLPLVGVLMAVCARLKIQPAVLGRLAVTLCTLHFSVCALERKAAQLVVFELQIDPCPFLDGMTTLALVSKPSFVYVILTVTTCTVGLNAQKSGGSTVRAAVMALPTFDIGVPSL